MANQSDLIDLRKILEMERDAFNFASRAHFGAKVNSIKILHGQVYAPFRSLRPDVPSQVIVRSLNSCLSAYKTCKSNKHKIISPVYKKNLSLRLDKRLYSFPTQSSIKITTSSGRKEFKFELYEKIENLLKFYSYKDPLIFERNGELWIALTFDVAPKDLTKPKMALGVDLGMRVSAACSDGRIIIDRKYQKEKRRLRYLKRELQSKAKKSRSAQKHLLKLQRKERNKAKNQIHLIANEILKTNANVIVLENLKGIKKKKYRYQNKRAISQVPFFMLKQVLTYKARNMGKSVLDVCPKFTSQTDSLTGKREGVRRGRRFYAKSGLIYDSDINAAINIGVKSKLPVSRGNLLDGQAVVNRLNVSNKLTSPSF